MKKSLIAFLLLISTLAFSQKIAPNTYTVSKSGMAKYQSMTDIIPNFPTYKNVLQFEITTKTNNKPIVMSGSKDFSIELLKEWLKNADLKSKVFLDLKLKHHDSKISACSYQFYIIE